MKKQYSKNEQVRNYYFSYIDKMEIDEEFKPLLLDILLRRCFEYELSYSDIHQDITSLVNNLKAIEVRKFPKDESNIAGFYRPRKKLIVLNEEYVKRAKKNPDDPQLYEILTHEVYHVLCRDERGVDRLMSNNCITGLCNSSLLEAIVEKAADRCVYPRNTGVAPYYKQNIFGYSDITFITDCIAATYGVTEKDFLRNAIMGRKRLIAFLSEKGFEKPEDTSLFLDIIEANYARLHNTLYPEKEKEKSKKKKTPGDKRRKVNSIKDCMSAIYESCERKFAQRIENTEFTGIRQATRLANEAKFNHNKLTYVMENALFKFSERYKRPDIMYDISQRIEASKVEATNRINDIDEVLEKLGRRIPYKYILPILNESKSGRLKNLGEQSLGKLGLILTDRRMFTESEATQKQYHYFDFSDETWENEQICRYVAKVCLKKYRAGVFRDFINNIRNKFRKGESTANSDLPDYLNPEVITEKSKDPFYKISNDEAPKVSFYKRQPKEREEKLRE